MLKFIEVLRAIEHVMSSPFLTHEEGVLILKNLRHELPGVGFEGPFGPTVEVLRKKITEAIEFINASKDTEAEARTPVLGSEQERVPEPTPVEAHGPVAPSKDSRGAKKKPRKV
jgi:hypothetical protein